MKYVLSIENPANHFIDFNLTIPSLKKDVFHLQLPSWRPGRYELGNFAKNLKNFDVKFSDGTDVEFKKVSKDCWEIKGLNKELVITYSYYAAELNAGSTYLDENQLYVNPVNCFMYLPEFPDIQIDIELKTPKSYKVYGSMLNKSQHSLIAKNFDELFDSPFIASDSVQEQIKNIEGVSFHFCFQGSIQIDWDKLLEDFEQFIQYQISLFRGFPHKSFYFLFQITPYSAYHGVEHHESTVILLGPSYNIFSSLYNELLGVSSHELYHVWNVKGIRPEDMVPYNFSAENYTHLGYVTEGVTTYMGDRVLYESNVFTEQQYFKELSTLLSRHFHNDGRLHYSVANSSWDTWLDGYTPGIPGRKVSIYVEGALSALVCDAAIRKNTNHKSSLHDVMRVLYDPKKRVSTYNADSYKHLLEEISGMDFTSIFNSIIYGKEDFGPFIIEALQVFGWEFKELTSKKSTWNFGFKTQLKNGCQHVLSVLENSAAHLSGMVEGDEIIAVNGVKIQQNLEQWLSYYASQKITLTIFRNHNISEIELVKPNDNQFYEYKILTLSNEK